MTSKSPKNASRRTAAKTTTASQVAAWLLARGLLQADVVRGTGINQMRVSRWMAGSVKLRPREAAQLEAWLGTYDGLKAAAAADKEAELLARTSKLAGAVHPDEPDYLAAFARQQQAFVAGVYHELATGAASESVRLGAAVRLEELARGRPTQHIVDDTPRPPATDEALLEKLEKLVTVRRLELIAEGEPAPLPAKGTA